MSLEFFTFVGETAEIVCVVGGDNVLLCDIYKYWVQVEKVAHRALNDELLLDEDIIT